VTAFRRATVCAMTIVVLAAAACGDGSTLVLNQQAEAHRLASHLHVQFSRAADASNRAVMANTDETSRAAAREAEQATRAVQRDIDALRPILNNLTYRDEIGQLDAFATRFAQYQALDADILPLAVENTNIKAQRLSFGPASEAVDAFRLSIESAGHMAAAKNAPTVDALVARAAAAVLEVQVIQARHIAESDEAAMSNMESAMAASESSARKALDSLKGLLPPGAATQLAMAAEDLQNLGVHKRLAAENAEEGVSHRLRFGDQPVHRGWFNPSLLSRDIDPATLAAQVAGVDDRDIEEWWEEFAAFEPRFVQLNRADAFDSEIPDEFPEQPFIGFEQQTFGKSKIHGEPIIARRNEPRSECGLIQDSEDVVFAEDQQLVVGHFDLRAGPGRKNDPIAFVNLAFDANAIRRETAVADRENATLLRLFLGRIRQDDTASGARFGVQPLDNNFVSEGNDFHGDGFWRTSWRRGTTENTFDG